MPEDVAKHLVFPNLTTPVPGMLKEVIDKILKQETKVTSMV